MRSFRAAHKAAAAVAQRSFSTSSVARTRDVYVAGCGMIPVTRNQNQSLESLGSQAILQAMDDAGITKDEPSALFVGNMMSGMLSQQQHLGPLLATASGLPSIEATTAEACCGAGGAALRIGYMAIASGLHDCVIVAGVEQMTHRGGEEVTKGLATASHWEREGGKGETFVSLNGALMQLYMDKYKCSHDKFAPFALLAHNNANKSSHAVFQNKVLTREAYLAAAMLTAPVQLFDASPTCDGAAAVVLTSNKNAKARMAASAAASDILTVADRSEPLYLGAVAATTQQALKQSQLTHDDVDIFELHDAYTSMACLSLESAGFAKPGQGVELAEEGYFALDGALPIATYGGLKARGHPVGATGVYQAAEMLLQLEGKAGANQVSNAKVAMTQNIGGAGSSVYTHVFTTV